MDYALSDEDIENKINAKCVSYEDLPNLDNYFNKYKYLFILYKYKPNFGHWVVLINHPYGIEFFDSYGTKPDSMIKNFPKKIRNAYGMEYPKLLTQLYLLKKPIHYNAIKLQKMSPKIQTCGKWGVVRCMLDHIPIDDFGKIIQNNKRDNDEIIESIYRNL